MRDDLSRRHFVTTVAGVVALSQSAAAQTSDNLTPLSITINGQQHGLEVDPRTTLLDLLRETLHLTGSKKGCDRGQCGACTVLVNGRRINSCLRLAIMHHGDSITTVEGLSNGDQLHPVQAAFIEHDGFQCGYCTPGQICSTIGLLTEAAAGSVSAVTLNVAAESPSALSENEIRERMSGNICRCGAYPNIVAAIRSVSTQRGRA